MGWSWLSDFWAKKKTQIHLGWKFPHEILLVKPRKTIKSANFVTIPPFVQKIFSSLCWPDPNSRLGGAGGDPRPGWGLLAGIKGSWLEIPRGGAGTGFQLPSSIRKPLISNTQQHKSTELFVVNAVFLSCRNSTNLCGQFSSFFPSVVRAHTSTANGTAAMRENWPLSGPLTRCFF